MTHPDPSSATDRPQGLARLIPESKLGSAVAGIVFSVPLGLLAAVLSVYGFEAYGMVLFCALPFSVGLGATIVYGYHHDRSISANLVVSQLSLLLLGLSIFIFAIEGLICLVMAAPIAIGLAAVGAVVGTLVQKSRLSPSARGATLLVLMVGLPVLMGFEDAATGEPPLTPVTSTIVVDAPPEVVWAQVVEFDTLPEPTDPLFATGIAYPTDARIEGRGVGAVRHCNFTTGSFVEPIEVWDEPKRLAFSVSEQPATMREWSIWEGIDAPHVEGFFVSEKGEFRLERLADERTELAGTTWYRHDVRPIAYWTLWSDFIIHRIHMRVLDHIKLRAEATE